ncbi:MAG TPA: glycosyltransferase family 39 protein [Tepidisphaeraceae bacterium]|jgi:4-amino-4-deoxy-L-arabinose transferase-like glycosyltransferase|nr:glycosyltransferase family 39 protein [Tepidisphaeraceae bacterium]
MIANQIQQRRKTMVVLGAPTVIVAAAILYFIGSGRVSLWDRDEAWYAQTSRQMAQGGDWVVPRFLDSPRYAKPIFIYWCQAASMKLLGATSLAARLPSAVAMLGTITLLAAVLKREAGTARAALTALIFASSAIVIAAAKMCLTDSVMLFFLTTAQLALFRIYKTLKWSADEDPRTCFVLWFAVAGAILTKGPFPLVVLLATLIVLAAFDVGGNFKSWAAWKSAIRWWRSLRPLIGLVIIICIVAPWLIMLYLREPGSLRAMLLEPVKHLTSDQDSQWVYPGYYPLTIWLTYFPWSLLLPAALIYAWKRRKQPQVRFALATILGNWIFVELMITKLPHYLLPSFNSLAFLTSGVLLVWIRRGVVPWQMKIAAVAWGLVTLALAILPWAPRRYFEIPTTAAVVFTSVGIIYAIAVPVLWHRRRIAAAVTLMGFGMVLAIAILFGLYFPQATFLRLPETVGAKLRDVGATGQQNVIMTGFTEPSLAFYQGGAIRPRPDDFLIAHPPTDWPDWIVLNSDLYQSLPPDRRRHLEQIASFHGFNYNIPMRPVTVIIARTRK